MGKAYSATTRKVTRQPIFIPGIDFAAINPLDDSVIVRDGRSNAVYSIDPDNNSIALIKQFHVSDTPSEEEDEDEPHEVLPEGMAVSTNGQSLYYFFDLDDKDYIYSLNVSDGIQTELYGPTSKDYVGFDAITDEVLTLLPNKGTAGSLLIIQNSEAPLLFDLQSKTLGTLNMPAISTISGDSKSTFKAAFAINDTDLLMLGKNSSALFSFILDVSSCDGQPDTCVLSYSQYQTTPDLNDDCGNPNRVSGAYYLHSNKQHIVYDDSPKPCYLDISTNSVHSLYPLLGDKSEFDYDSLHLIGRNLLIKESNSQHGQIQHYTLADDFTTDRTQFNYVGADLTLGESSVNVSTGREVVIDDANNQLIYLERNSQKTDKAEVYVLDFSTSQWRKLGAYPAHSFEIALLNSENNTLYVYNDTTGSNNEVFAINLTDGSYEVVISATEKTLVNMPDFDVDSIALNEEEQLIYLARRVDRSSLADGFGQFSLLSYNIKTKTMKEISEVNNLPEQQGLYASYDMSYDAKKRRVLFYHSNSDNPIWAVDVDTGERSVFTDQASFYGPQTSNARGQVIDLENNRLIFSSQDSQSLFSADLDTGIRTMLSPPAFENGLFFQQIIGVDLFEAEASAFVADEGFDGIYQVDLISGDRVLIHNPL